MEYKINPNQEEINISNIYEIYELSECFYSGRADVARYLEQEVLDIGSVLSESLGQGYMGGLE